MKPKRKLPSLCIGTSLTVFACISAHAQNFPGGPVRLITESAGSSADFLAQHVGAQLSRRWNSPVEIDNQSGKSAALVARSAPDGYTLLMGSTGSLATAPHMRRAPDYDPIHDFSPIALVSKAPLLVVGHPSLPATTLREFLEYARSQQRGLRYSSGGVGTAAHLTTAYLAATAGIDAVHVPYKGAGAGLKALLAGETQFSAISASTVVPQIRAERLRAYAVTTAERYPVLPDVPSAAEAGLPGFEATAWYGVLAPASTPPQIIGKINLDIVSILRQTETVEVLLKQGAIAAPGSAEDFEAWIRGEFTKWAKAVRAAGISAQ